MKLSILTLVAAAGYANAVALSSTLYYGDCWTGEYLGQHTKSVPAATATIHDPATITLTAVDWEYPAVLPLDKRTREEETTIYMTNQCTATRTASYYSTMTETVPTLTATTTKYASTAIVTTTSTCADWDC